MRFSWTGLLLAPLLAPFLFSATMAVFLHEIGGEAGAGFLMLLAMGCAISYATTIFLFLPALYLLSRWRPVTGWMACALGFVLGAVAYMPPTVLVWIASRSDYPNETFWQFFWGWIAEPVTLLFPVAGLVTAALYWWLGARLSGTTK